MFPVQFHPLVPKCETVGFQSMLVDDIKEVCWSTPFDASTVSIIFVSRCDEVSLVNPHPSQLELVQPVPHGVCQVLFS